MKLSDKIRQPDRKYRITVAVVAVMTASLFCLSLGNNTLLAQDAKDKDAQDNKPIKMKPVQKDKKKEVKEPETEEEVILIPDDKLLPGKDIIELYIEATGGRDAILANKSQILTGTFSMPERGINGSYTMYRAAPTYMQMELILPNFGTYTQGYNGETAWIIDPMMGPRLVEGEDLTNLKREADYHSVLNYDKYYDTIKTLGGAMFNDMLCYEVSVIDKTGFETKQYYDTESHLLVGLKTVNETPRGDVESITSFKDYKPFDNFQVPTNTIITHPGMTQIMNVTEVRYVEIEKEKFVLPDVIKELIARNEKEKSEMNNSEQVPDTDKETPDDDEDDDDNKKDKGNDHGHDHDK